MKKYLFSFIVVIVFLSHHSFAQSPTTIAQKMSGLNEQFKKFVTNNDQGPSRWVTGRFTMDDFDNCSSVYGGTTIDWSDTNTATKTVTRHLITIQHFGMAPCGKENVCYRKIILTAGKITSYNIYRLDMDFRKRWDIETKTWSSSSQWGFIAFYALDMLKECGDYTLKNWNDSRGLWENHLWLDNEEREVCFSKNAYHDFNRVTTNTTEPALSEADQALAVAFLDKISTKLQWLKKEIAAFDQKPATNQKLAEQIQKL